MTGDLEKIAAHYAGVDHTAVPIYNDPQMYDATFSLGGFEQLPRETRSSYIDVMSGPKILVASEMRTRSEQLKPPISIDVYCFDVAFRKMKPEDLQVLRNKGYNLIPEDIIDGIQVDPSRFAVATARYGIKNYNHDTQRTILREIRRILLPGGHFVLIDMYVPQDAADETYRWAMEERRHKSKYTVGEENAQHHLPTRDMWYDDMREAGLEPNIAKVYTRLSHIVPRVNWVNAKQMSTEDAIKHEEFLLEAPEDAKRVFNIRQEEIEFNGEPTHVTKIDYPVLVLGSIAV